MSRHMKPTAHAILLHTNTPASLLTMLEPYVRTYDQMKMLFASSVFYKQPGFLEAILIGKSKSDAIRISLASSYVLVIADVTDKSGIGAKLGFQP